MFLLNFNKPHLTGNETDYIMQAVASGHISGNGNFTKKCHAFFENRYGFKKCLLTTSCTDALEMAAMLIDIKQDDEVIMPSFTFVSTALAFVRQGAKIVFADSRSDQPNIDEDIIEALITPKTKAIVVVHYAGIACNMETIMQIADKYGLFVIEDAAQAIDAYYQTPLTISNKQKEQHFDYAQCPKEQIEQKEKVKRKEQKELKELKKIPLGSIGHLGCFSFHETKNIQCGEGGMLAINDERFAKRAEILWEKGTNRAAFWRGEVDKYGWVDIGSSFLPSDLLAAFLYAQLENLDDIQAKRKLIWNQYYKNLKPLEDEGHIKLPLIPVYATNNAHMFYIICKSDMERQELINYLKNQDILAVFHYQSLHKSTFYKDKYKGKPLLNCGLYSKTLLRLPFYYELDEQTIKKITYSVKSYFENK